MCVRARRCWQSVSINGCYSRQHLCQNFSLPHHQFTFLQALDNFLWGSICLYILCLFHKSLNLMLCNTDNKIWPGKVCESTPIWYILNKITEYLIYRIGRGWLLDLLFWFSLNVWFVSHQLSSPQDTGSTTGFYKWIMTKWHAQELFISEEPLKENELVGTYYF